MSKKSLILGFVLLLISTNVSFADTIMQQAQSPIYTDDLGRSHFLGKGGYSSVRSMNMGGAYASAVDEVANEIKETQKEVKENLKQTETDITNVINQKKEVPVASKKASFTSETRQMDPSASFGQGATYLPGSNLNNTKTIYTDDLGRLHFFGKGNIIKD